MLCKYYILVILLYTLMKYYHIIKNITGQYSVGSLLD